MVRSRQRRGLKASWHTGPKLSMNYFAGKRLGAEAIKTKSTGHTLLHGSLASSTCLSTMVYQWPAESMIAKLGAAIKDRCSSNSGLLHMRA